MLFVRSYRFSVILHTIHHISDTSSCFYKRAPATNSYSEGRYSERSQGHRAACGGTSCLTANPNHNRNHLLKICSGAAASNLLLVLRCLPPTRSVSHFSCLYLLILPFPASGKVPLARACGFPSHCSPLLNYSHLSSILCLLDRLTWLQWLCFSMHIRLWTELARSS